MSKKHKHQAENSVDETQEQAVDEIQNEERPLQPDNQSIPPEPAESVEDGLEELNAKIAAANDKYLRLMAEFDNYKRRTAQQYERMVASANEKLMIDIISVRENFERALKSKDKAAGIESVYEGMQLIFSSLNDVLAKNGLESFAEVGDEFDPMIHDAMLKSPSEGIEEDHICEIYERGYKLHGNVIKHAKVIVSAGDSKRQDGDEGGQNAGDSEQEEISTEK
ncbi:MAG: nucleotide exchange factor GrpE [Chitinivibrionales bacterium]|nr:nucleotide exchange factor GrpE [Chitinivibrionales bacterium]